MKARPANAPPIPAHPGVVVLPARNAPAMLDANRVEAATAPCLFWPRRHRARPREEWR